MTIPVGYKESEDGLGFVEKGEFRGMYIPKQSFYKAILRNRYLCFSFTELFNPEVFNGKNFSKNRKWLLKYNRKINMSEEYNEKSAPLDNSGPGEDLKEVTEVPELKEL